MTVSCCNNKKSVVGRLVFVDGELSVNNILKQTEVLSVSYYND
jgi:hypothetical protein